MCLNVSFILVATHAVVYTKLKNSYVIHIVTTFKNPKT